MFIENSQDHAKSLIEFVNLNENISFDFVFVNILIIVWK